MTTTATDKLIYLASPYSSPHPDIREHRFICVCNYAARMIRNGHLVFSPIAHSHPIADIGRLAGNWQYWSRFDFAMLRRCDELWILQLDGWDLSEGIKAEIGYWRSLGRGMECYVPFNEVPQP